MPVAERQDHFLGFNFGVELDGIIAGYFTGVSGLGVKRDVYEYHEGGENTHLLKFPGHASHGLLTLKRGVTRDETFFKWIKDSIDTGEQLLRKSGSILLFSEKFEIIKRWNFQRAFPVSWKMSDFESATDEIAVEYVVLAHEGLESAPV